MNEAYLFHILEIMGIAVFASSGGIEAVRKGLDLFGATIVGCVAALGGGTLRDLILDRNPVAWTDNPDWVLIAIVSSQITFFLAKKIHLPYRTLQVLDALGLAVFVISGTELAMSYGYSPLIVILLGMMTGIVGGVGRDIICNEVPLIFRRDVYATAAIAGSGLFVIMAPFDRSLAVALAFATIVVIRLLAVFAGLSLPAFMRSE